MPPANPGDGTYWLETPNGEPARCNPMTPIEDRKSADIEAV